jgi:hypothetical protein
MNASSGTSSSSSSHSASRSLAVLRAPCCQDCLRVPIDEEGETSRFRELFRERLRGADVKLGGFAGEGERERRAGAVRLARDGADGDVKPRLSCFPGACSCDCDREALFTCVFRLGYRGFEPPVRSRNECCAACGELREPNDELREPSKSRRLGEGRGMGKVFGPCPSSRLMSSKCDRSPGPITSERPEEWKLDDLEDLELVRSGGLPGAPMASGE